MKFFTIDTIKSSIDHLGKIPGNWLIPAFVYLANGVDTTASVRLAKNKGTDKFLDRYFSGQRLPVEPFAGSGNNLLRPRFLELASTPPAGDRMIRQDTKLWANILSSRGQRELQLKGYIEGERGAVRLTQTFKAGLEENIPADFRFEHFLVWLYAFEGFDDQINSWDALFDHLIKVELKLPNVGADFAGCFRTSGGIPWPQTVSTRPSKDQFIQELAPNMLTQQVPIDLNDLLSALKNAKLAEDDPVLAQVRAGVRSGHYLSFLFTGPPGTGKTWHARRVASTLTDGDDERLLVVQFHPAMSYDDFMEGFRPAKSSEGDVKYKLEDRLFLSFAAKAAKNPSETFVFLIDELNRGDVARIFGEALTYLEPDYRGVQFHSSYSGEPRSIPPNLVVIATANPLDRSVTDLDDALLRRFLVVEFQSDAELLAAHLGEAGVDKSVISRTTALFKIVHGAMTTGFGHANLMKVRTLEDLEVIWSGRMKPMLRRAFLHDKAKLDEIEREADKLLSKPISTAAENQA